MTPTLVQDWVTEQASRRPDATAVVSGAERLGYGDLDARSTRLARLLIDAGCEQGDRVAVLMPNSPEAVISLLGIFKAGCIYVPLDATGPVGRLIKILDSCEPRWLLTSGAEPGKSTLEEFFERTSSKTFLDTDRSSRRLRIGWLGDKPPGPLSPHVGFTWNDVAASSAAPLTPRAKSHDPSHILFTSGSTGTPKGVVITHSNVIHFIDWATRYFGMDSSDRLSAHSPFHFDVSFMDIFGTFAVGGELHLFPRELHVLPNKLAEFVRASEITQWLSVPSILNYMAKLDVVGFDDFPALRRLLWAGEVIPTPVLIHWMTRLPHVTFTNLYGPTETTISSSYHTMPACPTDPRAPIPIGVACEGEELLILDEALKAVPRGEVGDLYIAGPGLAREYWGDPERTRAAFLPHPQRPSERIYKTGDLGRLGEDGLTYFLGRRDTQIKSRGYRIELGEIEAALNAVGAVGECAVTAINTGGFEGTAICCAYVAADGEAVRPADLRNALQPLLPTYMVPTRWLALDRLPQNATGKIDRVRLKQIFAGQVEATHAAQTA